MKQIRSSLLVLSLMFSFVPMLAGANNVYIKSNSSAWRLQNYMSDQVVVWFTGSTCVNGQLTFPSNASIDDKNRFWSTVLSARMSGKDMYVFYDSEAVSGQCLIGSFGVDAE